MTLPTPDRPRTGSRLRLAFPLRFGPPTLPVMPSRRAVPITPVGRRGALVGYFPLRAAFPVLCAGRRPQLHFRGVLRVYSRYSPPLRSTAQGGLCREAPNQPVAQPTRSPATRPSDTYLDGTCIHWHHAPSVAHRRHREEISGHALLRQRACLSNLLCASVSLW